MREIGHVKSTARLGDDDPDGMMNAFLSRSLPDCERCGKHCLEAMISSGSLLNYLAEAGFHFTDIRAAISAARHEKPVKDAFWMAAHLLGHKLGPIVSALNLPLVLVDCFGEPLAFPLIVDGLREGLEHRMTLAAHQQLRVQQATCTETAPLRGAAILVLERHLGDWIRRLPAPAADPQVAAG